MPGTRQDLRRVLHGHAFEQAGYFTAAQARADGYTYQAQKYHVDHGNWLRVDRALFRLPGWPSDPEDGFVRWTLWSGGRGVISHDSALALHDLSDVNPARVHMTVPPGFRARHDAVRTHRGELPDDDVEQRRGYAVTTLDRTLLDVAGSDASQEIIDAAVADALERGLTTRARLRRRAVATSDRAALGIERALSAWSEAR